MRTLTNKNILLGITGGIAAYKSAELVRRLQDLGAGVRVIMTPAAQEFITPLTLQALSGNPVHTELLDPAAEAAMGHIELARWADLLLVAPASADFIAKLVQGQGGDLLSTVCLACRNPIAIAPAMNQGMWASAATQDNLTTLRQRDILVFGPASGSQACGDVGMGRMSEPAELACATAACFETTALTGKNVVITAGPTREALDPVRYLSNHSSGKMGYALAAAASAAGAHTILISGPTSLSPPEHVTTLHVTSALEMHAAALEQAATADVFIAAAAVADYRPANSAEQKIKKTADNDSMTLELIKNPDIVAAVAALESGPYTVGFAAETQDVLAYARDKRERKQLDLIVANNVATPGIGFNSDDNALTILGRQGFQRDLPRARKTQLATDVMAIIAEHIDH